MIKKVDKSYFKARDLQLVNQVISYLKRKGLEVRLEGSGKDGGRNYKDIDFVIPGNLDYKKRYGAIMELARSMNKKNKEKAVQSVPFANQITHYSQGNILYVDTIVENRFTIKKGNTIIDLCFEKYQK